MPAAAFGGWTTRGKVRMFGGFWRNSTAPPSNFYLALCTDATAPTAATQTLSSLTQIASGNGYTSGGFQWPRNTTGWPTLVEDTSLNLARVVAEDATFTASGGAIPGSGSPARYAVLTDDNATMGSRDVLAWWDFVITVSIPSGQSFTLSGFELRG